MIFVVDSREQKPYTEMFSALNIKCIVRTLPVGDYSIDGFSLFSIERKSLDDFVKSITSERERFERELCKAKDYEFFAVIIEADLFSIINHNYRSRVSPDVVLATMFQWTVKYKVPFILVECRSGGCRAIIEYAKAYLKEKGESNA